jgi:hypothetical protein
MSVYADNAYSYLVRTETDMADCVGANADYAAFKTAYPMSALLAATCAYRKAKCAGVCP